MSKETPITRTQALDYEIKSSWWAPYIGNYFLQSLAAKYFAWKVRSKMKRVEECERKRKMIIKQANIWQGEQYLNKIRHE